MMDIERVNEILRGSYDPFGILQWWARPRLALGNRTARQAWRDGDCEAVLELAKWLTDGGAT